MKKLFVLTLGFILFSLGTTFVKAETISYKKLDNIYFNMKVDGVSSSNGVTMFYLGSRLAYCIEPGVAINTKSYNATSDWSKTSLSKTKQKTLEKIGYYGYEYPNHQTDRYYIATQELIWQTVKNIDIFWTTGPNGTGSKIDVTKEKNEILSLVKKHETTPSFTNTTISGEVSSNKTVEDKNNVLNEFNITQPQKHKVSKQNNKIVVTFNDKAEEEILKLSRKAYDNKLLLVYTEGSSQKLASLRISNPEIYNFKIKSVEKPQEPEKPQEKILEKEVVKIIPKEEVKTIIKTEVVKVPSTDYQNKIKHFNVLKYLNYDNKRFN